MPLTLKSAMCLLGSIASAIVIFLIGGLDLLVTTFLLFVAADWMLAIISAKINDIPVTWKRAVTGWWKLAAYLILVMVAHRLDVASSRFAGFSTNDKIRDTLLIGLCGYELLSVIRNFKCCGCVSPGWFTTLARHLAGIQNDNRGGDT